MKVFPNPETQFLYELAGTWIPVLDAAGLYHHGKITSEDILLLAGKIMHDSQITALRMRPEFQISKNNSRAFETNWPALFEALGPVGKATLAHRIGALPESPFKGKEKSRG
jgi:hypothetical protein